MVAFPAFLFGTPAHSAPVESCTLLITGVSGESKAIPNGIDVIAFSWGLTHAGTHATGGGGGAGKVRFNEFEVTKKTDKSSPVLFENSAAGQHYSHAALACTKAGGDARSGQPYLTFEFQEVFTTSIQWSGSSDQAPTEKVTFEYGSLRVTFRPQNPDGSLGEPVSRCWDVARNQPC